MGRLSDAVQVNLCIKHRCAQVAELSSKVLNIERLLFRSLQSDYRRLVKAAYLTWESDLEVLHWSGMCETACPLDLMINGPQGQEVHLVEANSRELPSYVSSKAKSVQPVRQGC
jgi:hypothetical protein